VFINPKVIEFFDKEMILVQVDGEKDTVLAKKYAISGFPTLVMLDPKGEEIDRVPGYLPPDEFMKTFRDYKNGIGTLADLLNQAKTKTDREMFYNIAEKYKYRGGPVDAETWYNKVIAAGQPRDSLSGESRVAIADMYRRAKDYPKALGMFQAITNDFKEGQFGEAGVIYSAIVYGKMGDTANAIKTFEEFIAKFPKSEDVEYASKQITKLKNPPAPVKKEN
jgi:tetratricopeptide (TPR) repeat protein